MLWQLIYVVVVYLGMPTLFVTCKRRRRRLRAARWEHARQLRSERLCSVAVGTAPFSPQMVPLPERQEVTGRHGTTCEQWYAGIGSDFRARRCDRLPTCADYRREFGQALTEFYYRRPHVYRLSARGRSTPAP